MGYRHRLVIVIAALVAGATPSGAQPPDRDAEAEAVEGALEEPADPDDEADVRADDDPGDVGQQAEEPEGEEEPRDAAPGSLE